MTTEEALLFLEQHQPMPSDSELSQEEIKKYDDVRRFFMNEKDARCIPLFLNSFGYIDCFGVYQLVEDVICQFSTEEVIPHLKDALNSKQYSILYWNAHIASSFPSNELLQQLQNLLLEKDFDLKFATLTALGQFDKSLSEPIVRSFLKMEQEQELIDIANDILNKNDRR